MNKIKTIVGIVVPTIGLIATIIAFITIAPILNERTEIAQERVNEASVDLLEACDELLLVQNQIIVEYGPYEEYQDFQTQNEDNFKACKEGVADMKKSCNEWISGMPDSICKDPRLDKWS